jgi:hypothetical protein
MNKSSPARTLVITANRTTKRLFHKTFSNAFFHELILTTAVGDKLANHARKLEIAQHPNERSRLIRRICPGNLSAYNAELEQKSAWANNK